MNTTIDYELDAKTRLAECGGTLKITLADKNPAPWNDTDPRYRPHYRCKLTGAGGSYTFDFWDSIVAGKKRIPASEYDVLSCLEWNCSEDFEDFCAEFGYDQDSRRAHTCWRSCLAQSRALHRIFPSESARECLAQIR